MLPDPTATSCSPCSWSGPDDPFTIAADGTGLVQLTDSPEPDEVADRGPLSNR